ncbi:MAG: TetR family transcriptional regulator [Blastococcus sp.]
MSEQTDRRAQKKAQTRQLIRAIAHEMFAERGFDSVTIADIAGQADVAVQTVFNHFATKEELFFDGRTPWVDGPAEAIRSRDASVSPLTALRTYLVEVSGSLVGSLCTEERRRYRAILQASAALRAREGELIFEAERRLAAALRETWAADLGAHGHVTPADPHLAAPLLAGIWLTAARVLIVENRALVAEGADPAEAAAKAEDYAEQLFAQMQAAFAQMVGKPGARTQPDNGWPQAVRRAG